MTQHSPVLPTATISWHEGTAFNEGFGDYYCSKADSKDESSYVYLAGNRLPQRWHEFEEEKLNRFSIIESGFGAGLNFLNTAEQWLAFQKQQPPSHLNKLVYTSIEGFPLKKGDLRKVVESWDHEFLFAEELLNRYPAALKGMYNFDFGTIELKLILMPLEKALTQLAPKGRRLFDCVFLDGFSPAKNKSMWDPSLLRRLSYFCKPGSTLSTYTSASSVRKTLTNIGYEIQKPKGFGSKREMLVGTLHKPNDIKYKSRTPWFEFSNQFNEKNTVTIIGAGIAGCATAYALSKQGISCTLVDGDSEPGGTLKNFSESIYSSNLTADFNSISQFYWHSYHLLDQYLSQHCEVEHNQCGVFLVAGTPKRLNMLKTAYSLLNTSGMNIDWLEVEQTKSAIGMQINHPGLFNGHGGWLNVKSFCNSLINDSTISTSFDTQLLGIEKSKSGWQLHTDNTDIYTDHLVLCGGASFNLIDDYQLCRLDKIQGQTTLFKETRSPSKLNTIVNNGHYLIPTHQESEYSIGSNYDKYNPEVHFPTIKVDVENLLSLKGLNNDLTELINTEANRLSKLKDSNSTQGVRLTSRDHLPIIGPMPDIEFYKTRYPEYISTGRLKNCPDANHLNGLFVNTAHGSRGVTASLMSAEIITALITGQQLPLPTSLYHAVHPARFFVRDQLALKINLVQR